MFDGDAVMGGGLSPPEGHAGCPLWTKVERGGEGGDDALAGDLKRMMLRF